MADPGSSIDTTAVLAVDAAVARSSGADGYGLTGAGFVPKPFSRLLAEKLALARTMFGADIDLGSGSALRKILEVSALEDARTWAALSAFYDNQYVASARSEALSRLGEELGLLRPNLEARGTITLTAHLPNNVSGIGLPRGARLLTAGGHHVALDEPVALSATSPMLEAKVVAFYPGPEHNLDPANPQQRITLWNPADTKLVWRPDSLLGIARSLVPNVTPEQLVSIEHTIPLTGGELQWPDARYRALLLRAPRSIWTVESIRIALSLVPGVRNVQVRDRSGGVDVNIPLFGTFQFVERLFGAERDLAAPSSFDVVVAATDGAIWDGPDGLSIAIEAAIQDLRPIGTLPRIVPADPVFVAIQGQLVVKGLQLPRSASGEIINVSPAAVALKQRLLARVQEYIDGLGFGEPVRFAEVMWAMMNEPGVTDVKNLVLVRSPVPPGTPDARVGDNVAIKPTQIATFVDTDSLLKVI
jgi:hypothetical protein